MRKLIVIVILLCLLVGVVSCLAIKAGSVSEPVPPYMVSVAPLDGSYSVAPVNIEISDAHEGAIIDTWKSKEINEKIESYWWHGKGELIGIKIKNGYEYSSNFTLTYEVRAEPILGYEPAPPIVKDWVTISSNNLEIGSGEVWCVPVSLRIGDNVDGFPHQWIFGIRVNDISQTGMNQKDYLVQWLVTMKE